MHEPICNCSPDDRSLRIHCIINTDFLIETIFLVESLRKILKRKGKNKIWKKCSKWRNHLIKHRLNLRKPSLQKSLIFLTPPLIHMVRTSQGPMPLLGALYFKFIFCIFINLFWRIEIYNTSSTKVGPVPRQSSFGCIYLFVL